ncbi:MAG: crosslink repair DNA glycosylase YcaQ family protein [Terrimesophilobacter sp.]
MVEKLSASQARRIALAAQGFGIPAPAAVGTRQLNLLIHRLGLLQLDSVNVFERSHYLPAFARLGAFDKTLLDRQTFARKGGYIEYWAHEAAVIPVETWPLLRWRMTHFSTKNYVSWVEDNRALVDWVRAELAEKGPLAASAIEHDANKRTGPWWGHSPIKTALEALFRWGEVVSAGRTRFERCYALPEHILPAEILDQDIPRRDAQKQLLEQAGRAHGIGTTSDLADYFRLKSTESEPLLRELVDEGVLEEVAVAGWNRTTYLHRDARRARRIDATALLSPFDPVVWRRERAERLFDFHYRIEIYTPAALRKFGYYSLPILIDDSVVGRIDLKSDRQAGVLRVQSAWHEGHANPGVVAERLAPLLRQAADWQKLESISVADRGNLVRPIAVELGVGLLS